MNTEEIKEQAAEALASLEINTQEFNNTVEIIATGNASIGELDDAYKAMKQDVKTLNRLAKAYLKQLPKEGSESESDDHPEE